MSAATTSTDDKEEITLSSAEDDFQQFFIEKYFQKFQDIKPHIAVGQNPVIELDFLDLSPELQEHFYRYNPDQILKILENAANPLVNQDDNTSFYVTIRIQNFGNELDSINKINSNYIGKFVIVDCLASSTSKKDVITTDIIYECYNCNMLSPKKSYKCVKCNESDSFTRNLEKSRNTDFQILYIQELPERLKPGQIPHKTELHVFGDDLVNKYRAGDRIRVSAIVKLQDEKEIEDVMNKSKSKFKFSIFLQACNIENIQGSINSVKTLSDEDIEMIKKFNKRPEKEREEILIDHFAPHIEGYREIKRGLLVSSSNAGVRKKINSQSSKRMDSNVIMIGDPGTAKSELVKACVYTSPRGVYTSGRGSTAAGLTAAVVKDSKGQMNLEAGAMVMADQGLCGIDEFDKLREEDRSAIHECMEQQCYDDQTQVLTNNGWKLFKDISKDDEVATLSQKGVLRYQQPTAYIDSEYEGDIYRIQSRQVDLAITPNHNMYVNINKRANEWTGLQLKRMDEIPISKKMRFKKNADWYIPLEQDIDNNWLEFLGYYISEGCLHYTNNIPYRVHISQTKPKITEKIKKCLDNLKFKYTYDGSKFTINSKRIATNLEKIVGRYQKDRRVPDFIKWIPKQQISIFVNALIDGDGTRHKDTGHISYYTTSKQLTDDLCELALKIGLAANVIQQELVKQEIMIGGHMAHQNHPIYVVSFIGNNSLNPTINHNGLRQITKEYYKGRIYCVEVKNHVLYVRRNGKPVWCGNTYSVAKAGIIATLNTRTSVIAAANSKYGKYDRTKNILENTDIPVSLFTRFDLIYIVIDEIDFERDKRVAEKIGSLYKKDTDLPDDEFLSKYLLYIRLYAEEPELSETTRQSIAKYYLDKRIESRDKKLDVSITPRQLEGIYRLALSHAKMMCKTETDDNDEQAAIDIFNHMLATTGYDPETGEIDPGIIEGYSKKLEQKNRMNQRDLFETIIIELTEKGTVDISKRMIVDEMIKYPDKWNNEMQAIRYLDRCHQNDVVLIRPSGLFYLP